MIQQPLQWRRFCACYGHPTDTTTTSDRTAAISGTKPWLPKFTDLLLPIIMGASLTLVVTPQMLLATDRLTCTLVKLTTVAVKMATVGLLGLDALIYSITYNARIHNLIHSVCVVRFPFPLGTLKLWEKKPVFFACMKHCRRWIQETQGWICHSVFHNCILSMQYIRYIW